MITTAQMKELEDYAESQGISTLELMENAGRGFVEAVRKKYDLNGKRIIIFCGSGNNAGDGFVAARYFAQNKDYEELENSKNSTQDVVVLFFGTKEKLPEEAQRNYERLKWPITVVQIKKKEDLEKFHFQKNLNLVLIDALIGTGMKGEIREPLDSAIDFFNQLKGIKVAIDVPSGINPDTGERAKKVCEVELIVTFHDIKAGLKDLKQKTILVDSATLFLTSRGESIGIPKENNNAFRVKGKNGQADIVIE